MTETRREDTKESISTLRESSINKIKSDKLYQEVLYSDEAKDLE